MKLNVLKCLAPAALLAVLAIPATAQTPPPYPHHVDTHHLGGRLHDQQGRIHAGVENGSLTRREQLSLNEREARIHRQEFHDRLSGGRFTPRERRQVAREESRTSRTIYRQKHDAQNR